MTLKLADKQAIVAELREVASTAVSAVVADYRSLPVSDMTELHKVAREKNVHMRIYRNTLARRAVVDTEFACLVESLRGPIVLFFSMEEPSAAARLIRDFVKTNEKLEVKALAMEGELLAADQLKSVAELPSRDEALALLLSVMKAPVTKFVRTLNEPAAQFVRVMGQIRDQNQAA